MPEWTPVAESVFQTAVANEVAAGGWVLDGNYFDEAALDLVWPAADTLVWLDVSKRLGIARALWRSGRRVLLKTDLWESNRQSWSVLSPRSVIRLVQRWPRYSERVEEVLDSGRYPHLRVVRLRRRREIAN